MIKDPSLYELLNVQIKERDIERFSESNLALIDILNPLIDAEQLAALVSPARKANRLITQIQKAKQLNLKDLKVTDAQLLFGFGLTAVGMNALRKKMPEGFDILMIKKAFQNDPTIFDQRSEEITEIVEKWTDWQNTEDAIKTFTPDDDKLIERAEILRKQWKRLTEQDVVTPEEKQKQKTLKLLKVKKIPSTLSEFIKQDFYQKKLFVDRLNGCTLQEIGEKNDLSRERVRQITTKIIKKLPVFEDVQPYRNLLAHYDFSLEDFEWFTKKPGYIFRYIRLLDGAGEGRTSYEFISGASDISEAEKQQYAVEHKLLLASNGTVQALSSRAIYEDVLNLLANKTVSETEFITSVNEYVKTKNLPSEYLISKSHALEAAIQRLPVVYRGHGHFRQYQIDDAKDFIEELDQLFDVFPGIYGVNYFYKLNPDLMELLDIHNGTELANVIKQLGISKFPHIFKIVRQSQVWIGIGHQDDFYINALQQLSGKTLDEVVDYFSDEYAFSSSTTRTTLLRDYRLFFKDNVVVNEYWEPQNPVFFDRVRRELKQPIYSEEKFTQIIRRIDEQARLNPRLAIQLGYIQREILYVKEQYSKQGEAIDAMLDQAQISVSEVKSLNNLAVNVRLRELERTHQLVLVDNEHFKRIDQLEKVGITKATIQEFLDQVNEKVNLNQFFSWTSLKNDGFESPLSDLNLKNEFYQNILFSTGEFTKIITREPLFIKLSSNSTVRTRISDFLVQAMPEDVMFVDDLLQVLRNYYGLKFSREKLLGKVNQIGGTIYSPQLDLIYRDKSIMVNDSQFNLK
ncbi:sigma factor-like helix-turn-helix DNA-binding protein [Pediococcus claussenii]|nr:sigma factor-like helix-turn-helix DNA-binding protein [Pediococcus claussenii]ANZ69520.1 hypothetical protein AYR57_03980 [Pediococcus claussenii]ANZ71339.1 hypothetical protein AYR58_03995 [Pediococcus claussenii]KRN19439.1 hypothetical protein IV79_GL001491 [Pediococcus claussenii]